MTKTPRLDELQTEAAKALSESRQAPSRERAALLREAAEGFITAREHFFDRAGEPDWKGRTHAYRQWIQEAMSIAHVPPEETATLSAAVRYHSGNVLRERLDDETLEDLGLRKASPRERSIEKRERHAETLSIFGGGGAEITDVDEILAALRSMKVVLVRVNTSSLTKAKRRTVAEAVAEVVEAAKRIAGDG